MDDGTIIVKYISNIIVVWSADSNFSVIGGKTLCNINIILLAKQINTGRAIDTCCTDG